MPRQGCSPCFLGFLGPVPASVPHFANVSFASQGRLRGANVSSALQAWLGLLDSVVGPAPGSVPARVVHHASTPNSSAVSCLGAYSGPVVCAPGSFTVFPQLPWAQCQGQCPALQTCPSPACLPPGQGFLCSRNPYSLPKTKIDPVSCASHGLTLCAWPPKAHMGSKNNLAAKNPPAQRSAQANSLFKRVP